MRANVFSTGNKTKLVHNIVDRNFKKLFETNLPKLQKETGLERQDVINIYSRYICVNML